ncbi:unnamed protein product [Ceutorhynchus assimilis]|uniref:Uncharacterized protein n=1 Tax=Ceutorhynchus assimilis TaxID=467358 RepID=A0A9N9MTY0_9CUCU|nr:unnamed protein product [Ceutorhynchus assimilis]CAG9770552.1 unnamed protein product [Ceutorhynchus assimilis]
MVLTKEPKRNKTKDVSSKKTELVPQTQCRICLFQCSGLSLDAPLTGDESSKTLVFEALEVVIKEKVTRGPNYPDIICENCFGYLKISYVLITQYHLSKVRLLEQLEGYGEELTTNGNSKDEVKKYLPNKTATKNFVEIVVGTKKYSIEDLVIVEDKDERDESGVYEGFLRNLGTSVSATFVKKGHCKPKIDLEPSSLTLDIKKLETENHCDNEDVRASPKPGIDLDASSLDIEELELEYYCDNEYVEFIPKPNIDLEAPSLDIEELEQEYHCDNEDVELTPEPNIDLEASSLDIEEPEQENLSDNEDVELTPKPKNDLEAPSLDIEELEQVVELTSVGEDIVLPSRVIEYKCPYCLEILSTSSRLMQHFTECTKRVSALRRRANPKKQNQCRICGEVFAALGSYYYHCKKHDGKQHGCKMCDKKFFTASQARRHLQIHNKEKTIEICQICGKGFHYRSGLFYHMKMHNNTRNLLCSYCPKTFYTQTSLKRHELTHTGDRPFSCQYCSKKFRSKDERKKHYLGHTGDRPYSCKYCEIGARTLFNLKQHMTTHPGEFFCTRCDKTFADNDILQFHLRHKHKEEEEDNVSAINGEGTSEISDQWFDDPDEIVVVEIMNIDLE